MHLFLKLFILVKRSTCFGGLSVQLQELICQQAYIKQLLLAGTKWNVTAAV